ncbi:MAG: hypothetical protein OEX12_14235 [Gammaproteobacteria bacterium]|nr:hypothetical protein [Gammaproteobacteria bacterium]
MAITINTKPFAGQTKPKPEDLSSPQPQAGMLETPSQEDLPWEEPETGTIGGGIVVTADAHIEKIHPSGAESHSNLKVPTSIPASLDSTELLGEVGFSGGFTKNMGDFNSFRVDIHLHIPTTVNDIEKSYEFAANWVNDKLEEIQGTLK